jgi:hypothetical protein
MVKRLTFVLCVIFGSVVPQSHYQSLSRVLDWCLA